MLRGVFEFEFEHHDGDDDGQHAIAEGFESSFSHAGSCVRKRAESTLACDDDRLLAVPPLPAYRPFCRK
jgi:hypothetical protein